MKKHSKGSWLPKGAYPHPAGGYIIHGKAKPGDRFRVIGHLREEPDLEALAKLMMELAVELRQRDKNNRS